MNWQIFSDSKETRTNLFFTAILSVAVKIYCDDFLIINESIELSIYFVGENLILVDYHRILYIVSIISCFDEVFMLCCKYDTCLSRIFRSLSGRAFHRFVAIWTLVTSDRDRLTTVRALKFSSH